MPILIFLLIFLEMLMGACLGYLSVKGSWGFWLRQRFSYASWIARLGLFCNIVVWLAFIPFLLALGNIMQLTPDLSEGRQEFMLAVVLPFPITAGLVMIPFFRVLGQRGVGYTSSALAKLRRRKLFFSLVTAGLVSVLFLLIVSSVFKINSLVLLLPFLLLCLALFLSSIDKWWRNGDDVRSILLLSISGAAYYLTFCFLAVLLYENYKQPYLW